MTNFATTDSKLYGNLAELAVAHLQAIPGTSKFKSKARLVLIKSGFHGYKKTLKFDSYHDARHFFNSLKKWQ